MKSMVAKITAALRRVPEFVYIMVAAGLIASVVSVAVLGYGLKDVLLGICILAAVLFVVVRPELLNGIVARLCLIAAVGSYVNYAWPYSPVDTEIYQAGSQVVPVLVLALVIDKASEYRRARDAMDRIIFLIVMWLLLVALFSVFKRLALGSYSRESAAFLFASISVAITYLVLGVVGRSIEHGDHAKPTGDQDTGSASQRRRSPASARPALMIRGDVGRVRPRLSTSGSRVPRRRAR